MGSPPRRSVTRRPPPRRNSPRAGTPIADAEAMLAQIRVLWRDLLRNPYAEAEEHGVTGPQVTVMACLVARGPMAVTELSKTLGMSHSTASGIVDRLEGRGLVQRTTDAADRRRTEIAVTANVQRYVRELQEGPAGRLARVLDAATPSQRASVKKGLTLLVGLLEAQPGTRTR
jgi:MarR family transcriptional regulator, organic hydroperoxide resistance regulator